MYCPSALSFVLIIILMSLSTDIFAQRKKKKQKEETQDTAEAWTMDKSMVKMLGFRSLGPAAYSGRISDIAVNPENTSEYYVGVASGGLWKTENHGITFKPIFDSYSSYSIGCVEVAPTNHNTVWVGTGENNNQRSVSYGDGVYKSLDGGKTWQHLGLEATQHISRIRIHPSNPDIVYVAAQGALHGPNQERGIYKTIDGGKNWVKQLFVNSLSGAAELSMDMQNPEVLYAAMWEHQRLPWQVVSGGDGSGLYKTVDGGENWITKRLPSIARPASLLINPHAPHILYLGMTTPPQ